MRYYCPQYSDSRRGWVDVEALASASLKEANDWAKAVAERQMVVTRVIRKPKGWVPNPEAKAAVHSGSFEFDIGKEAQEARKNKRCM